MEGMEHAPRVPRSFARDFEDYWSLLALGIVTSGRRLFGADFLRAEDERVEECGLVREAIDDALVPVPLDLHGCLSE